jgi:hypothetical protein
MHIAVEKDFLEQSMVRVLQFVLIRVLKKLELLFQAGTLVSFLTSGFPLQFNAVLLPDTAPVVVDTTLLAIRSGRAVRKIIR